MENNEVEDFLDDLETVDFSHVSYVYNYELQEISPTQQDEENITFKGKRYKQSYRTAWESIPDFKGWLRSVIGQPCRAYCLYCEKTLRAHRLSLIKHMCTLKHQKAAQLYRMRRVESQKLILAAAMEGVEDYQSGDEYTELEFHQVESVKFSYNDDEEKETTEDEDDLVMNRNESLAKYFQRNHLAQAMSSQKPPISTHVLDSTRGVPVCDLQLSLYKLIENRWIIVNDGFTNFDGRFDNFLLSCDFTPGYYKIHYDVDKYFETRKQHALFPFIEIIINCKTHLELYHVPLLISPFSYLTYRET